MHAEQSITPPQAQFLQEQKLQQREDAALFLSSDLFSSKHSGRKQKEKDKQVSSGLSLPAPSQGRSKINHFSTNLGFQYFIM